MTKRDTFAPETGKKSSRAKVMDKLAKAEIALKGFKTPMGAFAQSIKVAAFRNALSLPIPDNFNQRYYGKKPIWATARIEKGNVVITFEEERISWDAVGGDDMESATLMHEGCDLVSIQRLKRDEKCVSEGCKNLSNKEWQHWLDLMDAAPTLLQGAKLALQLLNANALGMSGKTEEVVAVLRKGIDQSNEGTKYWNEQKKG